MKKRIILLTICLIFAVLKILAQNAPSLSPANEKFVKYQAERKAIITTADNSFGAIPAPLNLSHLKTEDVLDHSVTTPSSYDLRNYGKVTAVRNQGECGSCWAFASIASVESCLLTGETTDFSENNLKDRHGFDLSCCEGGNIDMAAAYFTRWDGPVNESEDAYNAYSCYSPSSLNSRKHIQDVIYIAGRESALDNEGIKQAVMNYGAVTTSMFWDDSSWNSSKSAYYYNWGTDTNHLIAVVGWDDNFSSSNFKSAPPGNGAFLIKNSWGENFGNAGYFWISYYDSALGYWGSAVFLSQPVSNYDKIYQYDALGCTSSLGYTSSNSAWCANIFTASQNHFLKAFSTHFLANNTTYELYVYKGCNTSSPSSGNLAYTKTGSVSYAGYHTIQLDSPVQLSSGERFSIVLKITTPGYNYPIPIEYPFSDYSSSASASAGQSFFGNNGSSWTDLTSVYPNTNVCLKAFAGEGGSNCPTITLSPSTLSNGRIGASYSQTLTASGGAAPYSFSVSSGSLPPGLTLSSSGTISGIPTAEGTYAFSVKAVDSEQCSANSAYTIFISAVDPPVVSYMVKKGNPFRIIVYGSNFQNYIAVYINGYQWSTGYIVGTTKIVLKGGASLKALVPKNTPTTFRFVNQDGGECTYVWQWP